MRINRYKNIKFTKVEVSSKEMFVDLEIRKEPETSLFSLLLPSFGLFSKSLLNVSFPVLYPHH